MRMQMHLRGPDANGLPTRTAGDDSTAATGPPGWPPGGPHFSRDAPTDAFYQHSSGQRCNTDALMTAKIRAAHPGMAVTAAPRSGMYGEQVDLLGWARATGGADFDAISDARDPNSAPLEWKTYVAPARQLDDGETGGRVATVTKFGKYRYRFDGHEFVMYVVEGRDGLASFPAPTVQYLVHPATQTADAAVERLLRAAGSWSASLHGEIWVFDGGMWSKSADLWRSVQGARWDNVILDQDMKRALQDDIDRFFDSQQRYERLGVAWKRGVIYHGPPGNGKTISIKAAMHALYGRAKPIPTLYVRSLASFAGPEASVRAVFGRARQQAPCLLVFEDLDAMITEQVRSYFLNEVDGLAANRGVLMLASTNHLDRLDPGLSKRPSRFDRKFLFPKPAAAQRLAYARFWRRKIIGSGGGGKDGDDDDGREGVDSSGKDAVDSTNTHGNGSDDHNNEGKGGGAIDFPDALAHEMARITHGFSFAYMQEAFVATLLAIAAAEPGDGGGDGDRDGGDEDGSGDKDDGGDSVDYDRVEDDEGHTCRNKHDGNDKFDHLLLWREFKKQVKILREEM